ncbi:hypothetical protein [Cupriavidus oxalaticus]|jgi:hypothetical protein|uniref:Lipoprotein n=1 Tax=Cupriavidus oxalaticus TaxID=96344 RepID=A0A375FXM4_9BURK|nr:hypothetical protein [Cupriavidus oxalaticus]QEZ48522.1 hypothetical protein D2917_23740 [Cupriavidus oxalaticus]QRQ88526.1 hypothetical protein JTE91_18325 [Cupriavidus oxalaticus]QRQ93148.1 hypothetical protein JTE92_23935 [Cupriavidus oxalaticus]WQD81758.1 hypothetical protein U0036_11670 [Cupriavidus oxalaticus]SPC13123.1 conserved exported hypothetical protein [Cupriavidus oxalaticus]
MLTRIISGVLCAAALAGCATKNYGRQGTLTDYEKTTMTCREIQLEQAKVQGFVDHVNKESEFDGRSVLSFLGDFGIGNLMEKDSAMKSATDRTAQLQTAANQRGCTSAAPDQKAQSAPTSQAR